MTMKRAHVQAGLRLGGVILLAGLAAPAVRAVATAVTAPPLSVTPKPAAPPPKPPEPPPPSVPDDVNPFTKDKIQPVSLKFPGEARPRMTADVHSESFDGLNVMEMDVTGPDFDWQLDPLVDFEPAPPAFDESMAFVYQSNTEARLSWTLYGPTELLPSFSADAVVQFLAAERDADPKNFILMTPIPKDAKFIQSDTLCGFQTQSVEYAIVSPTGVTVHQDWFLNLHDEYILMVSLSGPNALVGSLSPTIHYFLARSRVLKGLGVKAEDDAGDKPANTKPVKE